jgi:hypothetical protein
MVVTAPAPAIVTGRRPLSGPRIAALRRVSPDVVTACHPPVVV